MELSLRNEFEKAYSQRVGCLRKFYQMNHETLRQTLQGSYLKVLESQLLHTMGQDQTTLQYVKDMINDLFENVVKEEREIIIENLGMKIAEMKGEMVYNEALVRKLREEIADLSGQLVSKDEELSLQRTNYENKSIRFLSHQESIKEQIQKTVVDKDAEIRQLKQELKRVTNQLTSFKMNLTQRETKLQTIEKSQRELVENNRELANVKRQMELEIRELELQVNRIAKEKQNQEHELRNGVIRMLESKLKEVQSNSQEIQEVLKTQFDKKSLSYKKKIEEYKYKITELLNKNSILQKKLQFSSRNIEQLENKLSSFLQQNERSLSQYKCLRDRERIELQKKFEYQLKQFQSHYERLLQSKINDVEQEAMNHLNAMKECEREYQQVMEQKAEEYDNNYVTRRQYERMMKEKQETIDRQLMAIHQKELDSKQMEFKITLIEDKKQQLQKEISHLSAKLNDYEQVLKEEKARRKNLEAQGETLKAENKKYRKLIGQYEEKLKTITSSVDDKMKRAEKVKQRCSSLDEQLRISEQRNVQKEGRMRELQSKLKQKEQNSRELAIKTDRLTEQIQRHQSQKSTIESRLMQLNYTIENLSKSSVQLELKSKQQKFTIDSLSQENIKLTQLVQNLKKKEQQQASNLNLSISQMSQKYSDFKSIASKLESDLKDKDQTIQQLSASNQSLLKKKKRFEQNYIKLFKEVGQLSKCIVSVKEGMTNHHKLYEKQLELLVTTLHSKVQGVFKCKDAELQEQKNRIKQVYTSQIQTLTKRMREERSAIVKQCQSQSESTKGDLRSLHSMLSELKSECTALKTELFNSKSALSTHAQNSANQLFSLESQYTLLEKEYSTLKDSYRCLTDQLSKLQSSFSQKSQVLQEKQERLTRLSSEMQIMQKQLSETLSQNDLLNERKKRLQGQINQMRMIVSRAAKDTQSESIRRAKLLDMETRQLTQKVEMLKKMGSTYSATKDMIRG